MIERDGVRVGYEIFGSGEPTILFFTSWAIVHMRQWKAQVPYLARHFRVVTVEGRGNGNADRPDFPAAYADQEYVDDAVAVLEATGTARAVAVGLSLGGRHALQLAAWHPERVAGVVAIGAALPWPLPPNGLALSRFSVIYATPPCVIIPRSPVQGSRAVPEHLCLTRPYVPKAKDIGRFRPGSTM